MPHDSKSPPSEPRPKREGMELPYLSRMMALGQVTGGLAHEINNALTVIIWNLDRMARSANGDFKQRELIDTALDAATEGTNLLRRLMEFAHHRRYEPDIVDLADVLRRLSSMLTAVVGTKVSVELQLPRPLWPVSVDPSLLELAVMDLAVSASRSMSAGGSLRLEATNVEAAARGEDAVLLAVESTGLSRDAANGPDLTLIQRIAEFAGAQLETGSTAAEATALHLYFPRAAHAEYPDTHSFVEPEIKPTASGRIILLVEDDALVRSITQSRLEELGHGVIEAATAGAALDILETAAQIDLLFTDIVMPGGMSGVALAERAMALRPGLKVLFVSGYASSLAAGEELPGDFLQKPYRSEDLGSALTRALDTAEART